MTIEDAKVIGFGTLALLVIFLSGQAIYGARASIVAFFSGEWARSLERARKQKAAREQRYGYATVNDYRDSDAYDMSSGVDNTPLSSPSSLETRNETDRQTDQAPRIKAEELLTLCKTMRAAGIGREDAAAAFKASGLPFNNNVWAKAATPARPDDAQYVTPIVGRPTSARFETDPEFPYQAPA